MKIKTMGILAGLGGLALGTVVTGVGATVLLSNKDNEIANYGEENRKLRDKIKVFKAQSLTDVVENARAMGEMSEELSKASDKLTEALDSIDRYKENINKLEIELDSKDAEIKRLNDSEKKVKDKLADMTSKYTEKTIGLTSELDEENKKVSKLQDEIKKLKGDLEKYKEIEEAMKISKSTDDNLNEAKKLALNAEKQHKSLAKKLSKNSKK